MSHDTLSKSPPGTPPPYESRDTPTIIPEKGAAIFSTQEPPFVQPSAPVTVPAASGSKDRPYVPPPCFSRVPPPGNTYASFQAMHIVSIGKYLNHGFPLELPPSNDQPHPFVGHDVDQGDWLRFLADLQNAGRLTQSQGRLTGIWPMVLALGLGGLLLRQCVRSKMKVKKSDVVGALVDLWNKNFFHARKIEVVLTRGLRRLSGDVHTPIPGLHLSLTERKHCHEVSPPDDNDDEDEEEKEEHPSSEKVPADGKDMTYRLFVVSL